MTTTLTDLLRAYQRKLSDFMNGVNVVEMPMNYFVDKFNMNDIRDPEFCLWNYDGTKEGDSVFFQLFDDNDWWAEHCWKEAKTYVIARDEGMDAAMLFKLTYGGSL